jgi:hypothetical protein
MHNSCISAILLLCSSLASACSCSNSTPIQKTDPGYSNRAVFTARVVQLMGGFDLNGKRSSIRVIAVVHHRYWGLPAYWPSVVILDGGLFCGIAMDEEEYLVSGYRSHYGVLSVEGCSRTQPLASAQVDLRTLDGSLCTGGGGTLIGKVSIDANVSNDAWNRHELPPARYANLTFRDFYGKAYVTQSDGEGIYELLHVPPGSYTLDSRVASGKYAVGSGEVVTGICKEAAVSLSPYDVSGRLAPGISRYARVELVGPDRRTLSVSAEAGYREQAGGRVTPDGRFYFQVVPPGEYKLAASFYLPGHVGEQTRVYYPGTGNQDKAIRIRVSDQTRGQSFDFDPNALPLVSIPCFVESPDGSHVMPIVIRVQNSSGAEVDAFRSKTGITLSFAVVRGESYSVRAFAYEDESHNEPDWQSESVHFAAADGMKTIMLALTAR